MTKSSISQTTLTTVSDAEEQRNAREIHTMAKGKAKAQKGSAVAAQSHIRARISYLYKASLLLQSVHDPSPTPLQNKPASATEYQTDDVPCAESGRGLEIPLLNDSPGQNEGSCSAELASQQDRKSGRPSYLSRQYASQLQAVSLKTQLRLSREIKHSLCKRCDTLLVPGSTCSKQIENKSRGGKKPWADVLVVGCGVCGAAKRYPQSQKRTMRLVDRRRNAGRATGPEVVAD